MGGVRYLLFEQEGSMEPGEGLTVFSKRGSFWRLNQSRVVALLLSGGYGSLQPLCLPSAPSC